MGAVPPLFGSGGNYELLLIAIVLHSSARPNPAESRDILASPSRHTVEASPHLPPPQPPLSPARWSRVFSLSLARSPPNPFNAINATPRIATRTPRTPPAPPAPPQPLHHPDLAHEAQRTRIEGRDEYPLLTLPEQRRSRQSISGSLVVEPGGGASSSRRTSIGLPPDRRSFAADRSPTSPTFRDDHEGREHRQKLLTERARGKQRAADQAYPATYIPLRPEAPMAPSGEHDRSPTQPPDTEAQRTQQIRHSASRASLPLSVQQPSTPGQTEPAELRASDGDPSDEDGGGGGGGGSGEEDYAWGPHHPCFPHRNPHVPLNSPLFQTTRIIRIRRDWMVAGDLAPTFANLYPEVLDPLVSEEAFRTIIRKANAELVAAFSPFTTRAWVDALMGVATAWLWDDLGLTAVKTRLRHLEQWIDDWNGREGAKEGVQIIPLRRTGYMTIDFQIPDPKIGVEIASLKDLPQLPPAAHSAEPDSRRHADLEPSRQVQDLGALRAGGQQFLPSSGPAESQALQA